MWIEEWKIIITVSLLVWDSAWWDNAVKGISSATPECCLCHRRGHSQTYFQKGFQHTPPTGADIQSSWKTCTLSTCGDNSVIYLYSACWVLAVSSAATHPQTAKAHPAAVKVR